MHKPLQSLPLIWLRGRERSIQVLALKTKLVQYEHFFHRNFDLPRMICDIVKIVPPLQNCESEPKGMKILKASSNCSAIYVSLGYSRIHLLNAMQIFSLSPELCKCKLARAKATNGKPCIHAMHRKCLLFAADADKFAAFALFTLSPVSVQPARSCM